MSRPTRALLPILLLALGAGACDDPTEIEGHAEAEGLAIVAGSAELYRYMLDDGLPGPLTLAVGSHDVAIILLDHDGEPLAHEGSGDEEEEQLMVSIGDISILDWTPEPETGEAHANEEFHGTLEAKQAGTTSMEVCFLHGGHCDFEADIPVTVTAAQ